MARSRIRVCALTIGLVVASVLAGPPVAASAGVALRCDGALVTITGTDGDDVIVGTAGPDVIAALAGDDTIRGRGGDDVVCAGDGADLLRGDRGDDRLFGEESGDEFGTGPGDVLIGGAGDDHLDIGVGHHGEHVEYQDEPAGVRADLQTGVVTTRRGVDTIVRASEVSFYGSPYADVVDGSDRGDTIFGMGGDDTINGLGGDDRIMGGDGGDRIAGGDGCDQLDGELGDDVLDSGDVGYWCEVFGGPGDDHLIGTESWDTKLEGGPGNDVIEGLGYADKLSGGSGNDVLDGGDGTDKGGGGGGTDSCPGVERPTQCESPTTGS